MARINIEDSLFKDARFIDLCIHYGDKAKALGVITWAFVIAQKFYLSEESGRLIPLNEWKRQQCDDKLIEIGLAEVRQNGVYVSGSENQFAWLIQKSEAGKKGGRPKSNINEKKKAAGYRAKAGESGSKPLTLSPSLPLSLSHSLSGEGCAEVLPRRPKVDSSATWKAFSEAYQQRYRVEPTRNQTVNSQMANFVKRVPADEAPEIARFFVLHNKAWYVERQHPVGLLLQDAESLRSQWLMGKQITRRDAQNVENTQSNANAWQVAAEKVWGAK